MQLSEKTLFITGASDGIGKATAIECAKRGATVIIHGKTVPKLEKLYDDIIAAGYPEPVIYPLDFEKITPTDCDTLTESLDKEFGKIDGLFNNAGWLGAASPVQHYDAKLWHRVMQINLNAHFMLTQACLPLLNHGDDSQVVFTLDDKQGAYWGAYGAAKAGLKGFMQILADELENTRINVCGLLPGNVHTAFRTRAFPGENPEHLTRPEAVAQAASLLLSEEGRKIEGESSNGKTFTLDTLTTA